MQQREQRFIDSCYTQSTLLFYNIGTTRQRKGKQTKGIKSYYYAFMINFILLLGKASYFGRSVEVFFDDGKWYRGIIIGTHPTTNMWVTRFEDSTEQYTEDPSTDKDYKLL